MKNVLISACLYGEKCRYDGKDNLINRLCEIKEKCNLFPVCPEVMGGLSTPRNPSEIVCGNVITNNKEDVTEAFRLGAEKTLKIALSNNCEIALMKAKSPSCGSGKIYDGTFSKVLTDGDGITAKLLKGNGIRVFDETEIDDFLKYIAEEK